MDNCYKTGAGEFALWDENDGIIIWRKGNNYYRDTRHMSELERLDSFRTEPITKTEYLKYLSLYGNTLKNERM